MKNVFQFHAQENISWSRSNSNPHSPLASQPSPTLALLPLPAIPYVGLEVASATALPLPRRRPNVRSAKPSGNKKPQHDQPMRSLHQSATRGAVQARYKDRLREPRPSNTYLVLMPCHTVRVLSAASNPSLIRDHACRQEALPTLHLANPQRERTLKRPTITQMCGWTAARRSPCPARRRPKTHVGLVK